ncbi:MAG: WD40 repeat domain-containing protein [Terracidiphilus sp.]
MAVAKAQTLPQPIGANGSNQGPSQAKPCYDDSSYGTFIGSYIDRPLGVVRADAEPVELIISSMMREDSLVDAKIFSLHRCFGMPRDGIKVTAAGNAYTYMSGELNAISAPVKLPEDYFARLQKFLKNLPDDNGILPARGSRVIVQVALGEAISVRVYDRARLSDEIIELIRLSDSRIEISTPIFQPLRRWRANELQQGAATSSALNAIDLESDSMSGSNLLVAESPDGSLLAISSVYYRGSVLRVYTKDADKPIFELVFPNIDRRIIYPTFIGFNPDRSRFLLETNAPEIRVYETRTWQQVSNASLTPPETTLFWPSTDWTKGIAQTADGKAGIWDASVHRLIAPLNVEGEVRSASFSPHGDLLALVSGPAKFNDAHLTLWDAKNGRRLRELWPVRWHSKVYGAPQAPPLWWDGGRLLVAPVSGFFGPDTGMYVWDVSTGELQGTLAGCRTAGAFSENDRLFQICPASEVLEWREAEVRREINSTQHVH